MATWTGEMASLVATAVVVLAETGVAGAPSSGGVTMGGGVAIRLGTWTVCAGGVATGGAAGVWAVGGRVGVEARASTAGAAGGAATDGSAGARGGCEVCAWRPSDVLTAEGFAFWVALFTTVPNVFASLRKRSSDVSLAVFERAIIEAAAAEREGLEGAAYGESRDGAVAGKVSVGGARGVSGSGGSS